MAGHNRILQHPPNGILKAPDSASHSAVAPASTWLEAFRQYPIHEE